MSNPDQGKDKVIQYTVDGDPQTTRDHKLTPRQILSNAGLNPAERYLIEIKGKHQESYQTRMDDPIPMHDGDKFISAFVGPVPVS